jgi:hypothetical protein
MRKLAHLALILLVSACGSSSGTPPPTDDAAAPLPEAAVPETDAPVPQPDGGGSTIGTPDGKPSASGCEYVAALCAKLAECAPFFLKAAYGDEAGCADRAGKSCTEQSKSRGSGLNQASILACTAALSTATCRDVLANNIPQCSFHGSYADGTVCGDNTQCQSGFCSHNGVLCGVCAAKGVAGAACPSGSNDECQNGLVCSSGKLCAVPAGVGAACDDATAPCLMGSFCTTAKTCALTVAAGQECTGAYLNLGDGTVCLAKGTLAGQIGTATAGQPCGLNPGDGLPATLCAPGGVPACTSTGTGELLGIPVKGLCVDPIEDGGTCTAAGVCKAGAQCIDRACRVPSGRYCEQLDAGVP